MRPVAFGNPPASSDLEAFRKWVMDALREIERASHEDVGAVADDMTIVQTFTPTRTLDVTAGGLPTLENFVATFVDDMKKRGQKRTQ